MADFTQGIIIDGVYFDVPLVSIKRDADFLNKYAERTEDGVLKKELIGVYINYQMAFGTIDNDTLYQSLWDKLTEPVEYHDFSLPTTNGTYNFKGYIDKVSDEVEKILSDTTKFRGLTCKFIAKIPAKIPS